MAFKKYAKKQFGKTKKFAKKRYTTRTGGVRINQVIKDVAQIKRSLNVEHKHIDFKFGSGQAVGAQTPNNNTPIVLALPVPARGTAYNDRVGNQIRVVHMTSKIQFQFSNNQDKTSNTTCSARILFSKSGDDVPTINDLYELDSNGHYTRNSFVNVQNWKKYQWIKPLNAYKSHEDKMPRYPETNTTTSRTVPDNVGLHLAKYYVNKQSKTSIRMMFENGSDTVVTMMKPYLLLMSDTVDASIDYDPVSITGTIRMTYVDN